jgi:hypothetical protein
MKQTVAILILIIFMPLFAAADPIVSVLKNQTPYDGENFIINGTGFGTHNLEIEWLGGSAGNIEKGTNGGDFSKTKWGTDNQSTARETPKYTNIKAHSGSQSILSALPIESQYTSGFEFNNGSRFDSIYVSYWVYFDHVDSAAQWKRWRIRPSSGYGDMDGEIMQSDWYNSDGSNSMKYTMILSDTASYAQSYPAGEDYWNPTDSNQPPGQWVRVDIYAKGSSVDGADDGTLIYTQDRQSSTRFTVNDYEEGVTTRLSGSDKWQYFVFENYWGNVSAGTGTKEKIFTDDIYIQINDRSRVEIGDNEAWENCKHREIQIPTAWSSDGTSITITANQGSFTQGETYYLFVVDSNGVASKGSPISFGVGGDGSSPSKVLDFRQ